jgi:hypothetical protein
MKPDTGGKAVIEGDSIVIRVPIDALQFVLDGSDPYHDIADRYSVTKKKVFAKEICRSINREDERGDSPFHKMFDAAMEHAISNGCEGIADRLATQEGGRADAE